ncbi:MAG TPA: sigma-70 family RNA polymerase sigma factor [Planctomycetaceae bacterium]|jgi:RNA polymerase sigma-70 factor (ECF subfamily)
MDSRHEQALTRGLAEGDPDAWRGVYDLYAQPVWRVVARLMGPGSTDVADVVQETFLAAARSARTYDPQRGSVWLWLCGIARRHVALHYRRHDQRTRVLEASRRMQTTSVNGELTIRLGNRQPLPAEMLVTAELATLVRATLTELSEDHGTILAARYLEDVSVEQIADAENCSSTAIRSRLARARLAFREKFTRLCAGAADDILGVSHET